MKLLKKISLSLLIGFLFFAPFISRAACQLSASAASTCSVSSTEAACSLNSVMCNWQANPIPLVGGKCLPKDICSTRTNLACNQDGYCSWVMDTGTTGTSNNNSQSGSSNNKVATPQITNPISAIDSPQLLIGKIINTILGVVGSIALLMFIYGGFTWMTSGGNAENTKKGRDIIVWAAMGLAVIFLSYGLVKFLILNIK